MPVQEPPTWASPLIVALKQGGPPRGRSPGGRQADLRLGFRSPSPSSRQSSTSPGGFRPKGNSAFRGGFNHCNKARHKRQDCHELVAIKWKNNGKLPEGYKGAREIAYEKWRSNQKARTANKDTKAENVRALALSMAAQQTAHHTEDEDSDFSESELPAIAQNGSIVAALTRQEAVDTHDK